MLLLDRSDDEAVLFYLRSILFKLGSVKFTFPTSHRVATVAQRAIRLNYHSRCIAKAPPTPLETVNLNDCCGEN